MLVKMTKQPITNFLKATAALVVVASLFITPSTNAIARDKAVNIATADTKKFQTAGLEPKVLQMALRTYQRAFAAGRIHKAVITIVDFSKNSIKKRLWVIDLDKNKILYSGLVAHGANSGRLKATNFSNTNKSRQSSLGAFITQNTYYGKHGLSLRLQGISGSLNNHAKARAIVVHAASYATPWFAKRMGYLGRSWGCFALNPSDSKKVINEIKDGSLIFAYAPQLNGNKQFS